MSHNSLDGADSAFTSDGRMKVSLKPIVLINQFASSTVQFAFQIWESPDRRPYRSNEKLEDETRMSNRLT